MNGNLAVMKTWISVNCKDDIDYIVKIISELSMRRSDDPVKNRIK
ncbi:MAG: hypothetical protein ACI4EX_14030 [Lachnospiraceae bacterium]